MSDDPTIPRHFSFDTDAVQLRHEAVEIVARHARGLPGTRGSASPPPAPPLRANAARALEEGQQQLAKGCLAEALLRADTTIGLAPPGSDLLAGGWVLSGQVRLLQGNPQAARHAFARALDASPAHIEARLGLAYALRAMHQGARAIPIYLEAIALSTDERERGALRLALADTYRATGNADAARRVLRVRGVGELGVVGAASRAAGAAAAQHGRRLAGAFWRRAAGAAARPPKSAPLGPVAASCVGSALRVAARHATLVGHPFPQPKLCWKRE